MNTWKRRALALLSVPLLALPSAGGVYLWLTPHIGWLLAGLTAAGFELLYIGINLLIISTPELRRYARNVAMSGVATAIIFNTLARYQAMVCPALTPAEIAAGLVSNCTLRSAVFDGVALGLAILESIPLAGLAYAMSVLLHRLSEAGAAPIRPIHASYRAKLARQLWRLRSEARTARDSRASAESQSAMLAVARAELEQTRAHLAQQGSELAHSRSEAAQANEDRASWQQQAAQNGEDAARALRDAETSYAKESTALREVARLETEAVRLQGDLANARAEQTEAQHAAAHHHAESARVSREQEADRREYAQVSAQLREDLHLARAAASLDVLAVARRLLAAGVPLREIAPLVGVAESTLRGRLKSATNGHAVEHAAE